MCKYFYAVDPAKLVGAHLSEIQGTNDIVEVATDLCV